MVKKSYTRKPRRAPRAKKHVVTQKKTTWSKSLKSLIKRTVNAKIELKNVTNGLMDSETIGQVETFASPPSSTIILNGGALNTIFQTITQGSTQAQRIGNEITIKRCSLNGVIQFDYALLNDIDTNLGTVINQGYYVTMYIVRRKDCQPMNFSSQISDFFQVGSTSVAPSVSAIDSTLYVNKDVYTILHKKRFKVGAQGYDVSGYQGVPMAIGSTVNSFNYIQNNDFKSMIPFRISLTKLLGGTRVKYNDSGTTANNAKLQIQYMFLLHGANSKFLWSEPGHFNVPISVTMSQNLQYSDS